MKESNDIEMVQDGRLVEECAFAFPKTEKGAAPGLVKLGIDPQRRLKNVLRGIDPKHTASGEGTGVEGQPGEELARRTSCRV